MSASAVSLIPVARSAASAAAATADENFLFELYAATRAVEMALVPWSDEQRRAFLRQQFAAQDAFYRERYADAAFDIIKIGSEPVGRFYRAELADEIRIVDICFAPERFDRRIFINLIEQVLRAGDAANKPVQIYLESFDRTASEIFAPLGFQKAGEHGIHILWRREPSSPATVEM